MQRHRVSYLKTTLGSLGLFLLTGILTIYWFVAGQIRGAILGLILVQSPWLYWLVMTALILLGFVSLLIGLGGLLALRGDLRLRGNG